VPRRTTTRICVSSVRTRSFLRVLRQQSGWAGSWLPSVPNTNHHGHARICLTIFTIPLFGLIYDRYAWLWLFCLSLTFVMWIKWLLFHSTCSVYMFAGNKLMTIKHYKMVHSLLLRKVYFADSSWRRCDKIWLLTIFGRRRECGDRTVLWWTGFLGPEWVVWTPIGHWLIARACSMSRDSLTTDTPLYAALWIGL